MKMMFRFAKASMLLLVSIYCIIFLLLFGWRWILKEKFFCIIRAEQTVQCTRNYNIWKLFSEQIIIIKG